MLTTLLGEMASKRLQLCHDYTPDDMGPIISQEQALLARYKHAGLLLDEAADTEPYDGKKTGFSFSSFCAKLKALTLLAIEKDGEKRRNKKYESEQKYRAEENKKEAAKPPKVDPVIGAALRDKALLEFVLEFSWDPEELQAASDELAAGYSSYWGGNIIEAKKATPTVRAKKQAAYQKALAKFIAEQG
jgi:hypothetical protein